MFQPRRFETALPFYIFMRGFERFCHTGGGNRRDIFSSSVAIFPQPSQRRCLGRFETLNIM